MSKPKGLAAWLPKEEESENLTELEKLLCDSESEFFGKVRRHLYEAFKKISDDIAKDLYSDTIKKD